MQTGALVELNDGHYGLLAPIAASSYGEVWRAVRQSDGLAVALKLVNRAQMARVHPALHALWIDSALQETLFLRALAPWDQRHIVRLLDSGEHAGMPALALELLGPDLGAVLRSGRPPLQRALAWLGQINQALAKVHQYGWSYLDLKPANLLLAPDGGLRLGDFGACRPQDAGPARSYAGTAAWQAPEQFFAGPSGYALTPRSDYFSLGALAYFLVTGQALRFGRILAQAWREHGGAAPAILKRPPPTLMSAEAGQVEEAAGAPALALLRTLLAPHAQDRPANALQISRMLAEIRVEACA